MLQLNFTPFPIVTTERLILRQLQIEDTENLFAIRSDDSVNAYINRTNAASVNEVVEFITKINQSISNNESLYWAINLKDNPKLIGTIVFWNISTQNETAEIGFELHPAYQKKGIMQEAFSKVIDFGFHVLEFEMIEAVVNTKNKRSIRLLEKFNFELHSPLENSHDEVTYILNNEHNTEIE